MNKTKNPENQSASRPTDAEIQRMHEESINRMAWETEMKAKVHQMTTNGKLVVIRMDDRNAILIAE